MHVTKLSTGPQAPVNHSLVVGCIFTNKTLCHRSIVPKPVRCSQQVRSFRLGLWSSYLDPSFHKELQRRHRVVKHKYAEVVNRKLSWDRHHPRYAARLNFKSFMCSAWKGLDPRPGGRWIDSDELQNIKKGSPEADGHCDLVDQIFRGRHGLISSSWLPSQVKWATVSKTNLKPSHHGPTEKPRKHDRNNSPQMADLSRDNDCLGQVYYDIDPITNRKVYRKTGLHRDQSVSTNIPVQTFKGHQSPSDGIAQGDKDSDTDCGYQRTIHLDETPPAPAMSTTHAIPEAGDHIGSKTAESRPSDTMSISSHDDFANTRLPPDVSSKKAMRSHTGLRTNVRGDANVIEPALSRFSKIFRQSDFSAAEREEDLDLLTAEGIRARSKHLSIPSRESVSVKSAQRDALETSFVRTQLESLSRSENLAAMAKVKQCKARAQELEIERSELLNHNAHARGKVDAKLAELQGELEDMDREQSIGKIRKVTGTFTRDFPEEFTKTWTRQGSSAHNPLLPRDETHAEMDAWGYSKVPKGLEISCQQEKEHPARVTDCRISDNLKATATTKPAKTDRLQSALDRLAPKVEEQIQAELDPYTKVPLGLETSYIDECNAKGNPNPAVIHTSYGGDQTSEDVSQLSSHTVKEKKRKDKELVREVRNIYESTYGTIDCKHRHSSGNVVEKHAALPVKSIADIEDGTRSGQYFINDCNLDFAKIAAENGARQMKSEKPKQCSTPARSTAPVSYYIVAYEPDTQTFTTLEASSSVEEAFPPQSLTEVLLRLSSPAKFFPHIRERQKKGYELLSGSGDLLVFHKSRGMASVPNTPHKQNPTSVNPIDGMAALPQPVTGNFASPTGFVNHDMPAAPSPFKSGIDVRREEPVFSGRGTGWQDGGPKRQSATGRRWLIGAAWVAACSYAVGVVTEFFRTGGADGLGPSGM